MCTKQYFGSCSTHNYTPAKRIVVQSVDDCFNECKNNAACKGFDLDSKGGCLLAYQDCSEDELIEHPVFGDTNIQLQFIPKQEFESLQFTYYPMKGCKAPGQSQILFFEQNFHLERSPKCDETLADKVDDHMGTVMQSISSIMPYFDKLNEEFAKSKNDNKHFREIIKCFVIAFGTISGVLLLAILALMLNRSCNKEKQDLRNIPMTESAANHAPANNQTTVGGAVINIHPRHREDPAYNGVTY